MQFLYFLSLSFLFVLTSCQSTESFRFSGLNPEKSVSLESLIANWDESVADINRREPSSTANWKEDLHNLCFKQENLCEFSTKGSKRKDSNNKKLINDISQNIESENFDLLKDYSVDKGLKFFSRQKKNKLFGYADHLLQDSQCRAIDLRHSLASTLEDSLPDLDVKNKIQTLYESNSVCPQSRTMALSSYRAAMLRLMDQDCAKATSLLEKVTASSEDYLKPRSIYWTWKCQKDASQKQNDSQSKILYFSYHRIMMEDNKSPEMLAATTPAMKETSKNENLNLAARMAEKLLAQGMNLPARSVLEKIRIDRVQEVEPEFQVYWARLLHLTDSGIKKFQVLAALINTYPQFRSKTVKDMLFPTSFFENVEAQSKKLDPWLVQSLIRQESAFDPHAKSRVGATGLMQLMPSTAKRILKTRGQLKDPTYNIHAGVVFLENLVNRFDGQVHLALAAYNAGPLRVEEWQKRYPTNDPLLFVDIIPYRETREYVAFILRNYHWYRTLNPKTEEKSQIETVQNETQNSLYRMATQIESF